MRKDIVERLGNIQCPTEELGFYVVRNEKVSSI